jgi:hypothetical protein
LEVRRIGRKSFMLIRQFNFSQPVPGAAAGQ